MGLFDDFMKKVQTVGKTPEQIKTQEEKDFLFNKAERDQFIKQYLEDKPVPAPQQSRDPKSIQMDVIARALGNKKIQAQLKAPPGVVSPGFKQEPQAMTFGEMSGLDDSFDARQVEPWRRGQDPSKALDDLNREAPPLGQQPERYEDDPLRGLVKEDYIPDTTIMDEEVAEAKKSEDEREEVYEQQQSKIDNLMQTNSYMNLAIADLVKGEGTIAEDAEMSKAVKKSFKTKSDRGSELTKFIADNWMPVLGLGAGAAVGGVLGAIGGAGFGYAAKNISDLDDDDMTTIGLGLAGLGDALSSAYGGKTKYLSTILELDLKEKELAQKLKAEGSTKQMYDRILQLLTLDEKLSKITATEGKAVIDKNLGDPKSNESRMRQDAVLYSPAARYAVQSDKRSPWYKKPQVLEEYIRKMPYLVGGKDLLKEFSASLDKPYVASLRPAKTTTQKSKDLKKEAKEKEKDYKDMKKAWGKKVAKEDVIKTGSTWRGIDKVLGEYNFKKGYTKAPEWDWGKFVSTEENGQPVMYYDGIKWTYPRFAIKGVGFDNWAVKRLQGLDARNLVTAVKKLQNVEMKKTSGSEVTANELERKYDEFAQTGFNSTAEWLGKLKELRGDHIKTVRDYEYLVANPAFFERYAKESRTAGREPITAETSFQTYRVKDEDFGGYLGKTYPALVERAFGMMKRSNIESVRNFAKEEPAAAKKQLLSRIIDELKKMPGETEAQRRARTKYITGKE